MSRVRQKLIHDETMKNALSGLFHEVGQDEMASMDDGRLFPINGVRLTVAHEPT